MQEKDVLLTWTKEAEDQKEDKDKWKLEFWKNSICLKLHNIM